MLTEKEKMISGAHYLACDEELTNDRLKAKKLCFDLNQTCPSDSTARQKLINQLLGQDNDAWLESPFNCDYGYNLKLGKRFYANHGCVILDCAPITIGDNCLLAPGVVIAAATHPLDPMERAADVEYAKPINIGHNVWLGANTTICPGVTIGDNVVVGAGSVVTKDLPPNTLCVGSPAKPIRTIESHENKASFV